MVTLSQCQARSTCHIQHSNLPTQTVELRLCVSGISWKATCSKQVNDEQLLEMILLRPIRHRFAPGNKEVAKIDACRIAGL